MVMVVFVVVGWMFLAENWWKSVRAWDVCFTIPRCKIWEILGRSTTGMECDSHGGVVLCGVCVRC